MRKTRRILLRLLGLLVLLVVVLGGLAAAGWLPPFTSWVENRLLAELRVLGVETDATHLRELTWKRAVVGPVKLELPGLTLNAAEARAELGWEVLARRGAPHVVLEGLVLEGDLRRLGELRGALQPKEGGFPYGRLEILRSRVVLRNGDQRMELPFTGFFESSVEAFHAELVVTGPALSGRVSIRGDLIADSVEVVVTGGEARLADWATITNGVLPGEAAGLEFGPTAQVALSGSGTLVEGRWDSVKCEAAIPGGVWRSGGHSVAFGAGRFAVGAASAGAWRCEARPETVCWTFGDRGAALVSPLIVYEPGSLRVTFAEGRGSVAGLEIAGGGEIGVRLPADGGPVAAEAKLRLREAGARGWALAREAELALNWNGAELSVSSPEIELAGARPLHVAAFEATAGGFASGQPRLVAKADAGIDLNRWFASAGSAWRVDPAIVAGKLDINAVLVSGAEGARAEIVLPSRRRTVFSDAARLEAVAGGEIVLNVDRDHVSGRAAIEVRDVIARRGALSLLAPEGKVAVRWPRVWTQAVMGWSKAPVERVVRDVLWAGDYEVALTDAVVRGANSSTATGVDFKWASRGSEIYETGGVSVGVAVAGLEWGGVQASDLRLAFEAGLEGGSLTAAASVAGLQVRPTVEQRVAWSDGFELEGTWGFDPTELTGREQLARWWPQLAGWGFRGGVTFSGHDRYAAGEWSVGGDLVLQDLHVKSERSALALDGIKGRIAFDSLAQLRTAPDQRLVCRSGIFGDMVIDNLETTFAFSGTDGLAVSRLEGVGFGGRLSCAPFTLDPTRPDVATRLSLDRVKIGELLRLFDDVPAEADGLVDGMIPVSWRAGRVGFGTGYLRLSEGEVGRVHFTRDLHLLTRGRRPGSPEYASLVQVEQSIRNLVFNRLQIDLYPRDESGRSMRVRMVGAPAGGEFAVPVSIDVNVNAPLEHFLNWGLGGR